MHITILDFYEYVFGNRAHMRATGENLALTDEQQFEKEVRNALAQTAKRDKFNFIIQDKEISDHFRSLLRALQNEALEDLLYGDHRKPLPEPDQKYKIPNDEEISTNFKQLDSVYGYFQSDQSAEKDFITLFKACKLIADYAEKNNVDNNRMVYLHAYKIMVLLKNQTNNPCAWLDVFINTHNYKTLSQPLHEILLWPIPQGQVQILL